MDINEKSREIKIKITDDVLKGVYANTMAVTHTREEFLLDFINIFPPSGIVNARVIISPGHLKRIIAALRDNMRKYEEKYGEIKEAPEPVADKTGFIQ
ncbi:MAG: DUF3467 domain-containing protein [Acidobacteriota bacterium]